MRACVLALGRMHRVVQFFIVGFHDFFLELVFAYEFFPEGQVARTLRPPVQPEYSAVAPHSLSKASLIDRL